MWFAVTAKPVKRGLREKNKEFYSAEILVILNGNSKKELEIKLNETKNKFPQEMNKYLKAGIKYVEADNLVQAKRKSKNIAVYFNEKGQFCFF